MQLRGRSGRQGDPGSSVFYLSLEDDLMRLLGQIKLLALWTEWVLKKGGNYCWNDNRAIGNAQKKVK